jgi:diguanylate cyclase (GGDEF)-like protein
LAISSAKRHKSKLALMYFDLDNFKMINDSWGHEFGDLYLKHVADTLKENTRETDTVARLGGDEFCIVISDAVDDVDIMHIADNILHNLNKKTSIGTREVSVTTSIGISLYPDDGDNIGELMKRADMAMYHAKQRGKNNFQFYEEFLNANAEHRLQMELKIKEAIQNNEFELYYQPQFDIRTGIITGVEALIRWFDEDGNIILPSEFIPIAEETSLIIDLGKWVIHQACHEFKSLMNQGFPAIKVAINISANQFHQSQVLVNSIENALQSSGLPSHLLQLELTESVLIDDVDETISIIEKLKSQNLTFAIDDFGTGYSSLSYLKRFPVDTIKIDRCFIRDIDVDPNSRAIIRAISVMAHELELHVLAEGVEDKDQMAFLEKHNCDFVQGFLTAKPMPAKELLEQYIKGFDSSLLH